jgi:hypothetical protein
MPTVKETRVRSEGLWKTSAAVRPASGRGAAVAAAGAGGAVRPQPVGALEEAEHPVALEPEQVHEVKRW